MSGHSKWSTIKRKKGAQDAKRSQLFAKLLRAVEVAAREGGPSVDGNMTLASAVDKARESSVPWDNIERAIKRGSGAEAGSARYDEALYEGYGPGGVAILVEALTDNRNRTGQEVRHAFTHGGGNLGEQGSVAWMFNRRGLVEVEKSTAPSEERILEVIVEAGADDLTDAGEQWEIITEPETLRPVRQALEQAGVPVASADLTMIPQNTVPVGADKAASVLRLIESLEDLEDVQAVHANFDIPDEVLAEVG
ncbi:MAG TPA: YebC/PmpR family DNA-binding transcriptional regulator [Actinomycetota bacterium]|nr:YebC/PmpR family DNA-binding transcriptional regulator [Actinomycetota bacterium]